MLDGSILPGSSDVRNATTLVAKNPASGAALQPGFGESFRHDVAVGDALIETGVEVTLAMVHGGPYPATSDGRTTSLGTLSMMRFLRPVCYQDIPEALLPPAVQSANPWKLPRRINGTWDAAP